MSFELSPQMTFAKGFIIIIQTSGSLIKSLVEKIKMERTGCKPIEKKESLQFKEHQLPTGWISEIYELIARFMEYCFIEFNFFSLILCAITDVQDVNLGNTGNKEGNKRRLYFQLGRCSRFIRFFVQIFLHMRILPILQTFFVRIF